MRTILKALLIMLATQVGTGYSNGEMQSKVKTNHAIELEKGKTKMHLGLSGEKKWSNAILEAGDILTLAYRRVSGVFEIELVAGKRGIMPY